MARNAEKAMTTLARWRAAQNNEGAKKEQERRPYLASECRDLRKAEKWRMQIIREIAKKVAQIQNAGLGEFRIRDLNDEINKLLREKRHWEVQIKELGGPDYSRVGPRMLDHEGREVPGNRGYKYFGAAKELPGVRELFEQEPPPPPRKTRAELMKDIDADYYGYMDDDDGILVPLEQKAEKEAREKCVKEWIAREKEPEADIETTAQKSIPSQQDIQKALLARKKKELLEMYGYSISTLQSQSAFTECVLRVIVRHCGSARLVLHLESKFRCYARSSPVQVIKCDFGLFWIYLNTTKSVQ